jgi:hypothetical protein
MKKRKPDTDSDARHRKRIKISSAAGQSCAVMVTQHSDPGFDSRTVNSLSELPDSTCNEGEAGPAKKGKEKAVEKAVEVDAVPQSVSAEPNSAPPTNSRRRIRKLQPPRPFPTVPTSVSATGPRSAHQEGKNLICITRRTPLGAYMRRCKDVIIKDGCVFTLSDNATMNPDVESGTKRST